MKIASIYLSFALVIVAAQASAGRSNVEPISEAEAAAIVKAGEDARAVRKAKIRADIESATVAKEFIHQKGPRQVVLRRVHRPAFSIPERNTADERSSSIEDDANAEAFSPMLIDDYRREMISFSAYRYDDLYAAITWREQGSPEAYTLWTNVPLEFLPALNSFEFGGVHYDYFGFVYEISKETEQERSEKWSFHGHEYESRWKTPPVELSATEPEYVVVADDPAAVPRQTFRTNGCTTRLLSGKSEQFTGRARKHEEAERSSSRLPRSKSTGSDRGKRDDFLADQEQPIPRGR